MDDNQLREKKAELRELEQATAIEQKRRGQHARDNRSFANTAVAFNA